MDSTYNHQLYNPHTALLKPSSGANSNNTLHVRLPDKTESEPPETITPPPQKEDESQRQREAVDKIGAFALMSSPKLGPPETASHYGQLESQARILEMAREKTRVYNDLKKYQQVQNQLEFASQLVNMRNWLFMKSITPLSYGPCTAEFQYWSSLPADLTETAKAMSMATGWDQFTVLLALLGVISMAMRGRYVVMPSDRWVEAATLYLLIVSGSGTRKSQLLSILKKPFIQFSESLQSQFVNTDQEDRARNKFINQTLERFKKKFGNDIVKECIDNAQEDSSWRDIPELIKARTERLPSSLFGNSENDKVMPRLFVDGSTPQGMGKLMAENGEYIALMEAEDSLLRRLSDSKKYDPNLFLKGYTMESYSCESLRHLLLLKRPAIGIMSLVQPQVLEQVYNNSMLSGVGITPRIVSYFAPPVITPEATDEGKISDTLERYSDKIDQMLNRNYTQDVNREIHTIAVDADAFHYAKSAEKWAANEIETRQCEGMESFLRKFHGLMVRISSVIHAWRYECPESQPIHKNDVGVAGEIAKAFIPHAEYVLSQNGLIARQYAMKILKTVTGFRGSDHMCTRATEFTAREINQYTRGLHIEQIMVGLEYLKKHNILDYMHGPKRSVHCVLNPKFDLSKIH